MSSSNSKTKISSAAPHLKTKAKSLIINTVLSDSLLYLLTFISKIINVIFIVLIARSVSKKAYALANVYFSFLYLLITTIPKNVIRRSASHYCHDLYDINEISKFKESTQLAWLINFILTIFAFLYYYIFTSFNPELNEYKFHLIIYVFSALIEIYCEPIRIFMNVNLNNIYKCFLMFSGDYMLQTMNYILSQFFCFDLWSFTLSRLITSVFYCLYLLFLLKFHFKFKWEMVSPSFDMMKRTFLIIVKSFFSITNNQLIDYFMGEMKSWTIKTLLQFPERLVLSFFVKYNDDIKAEYSFVQENFNYFITHSLYPSEENFFILLNKIKNYKNLTTLKCSKDSNTNEYNGDFSFNENQYINTEINKKNSTRTKETYAYKILKTSIRVVFILGIILMNVLTLLGQDVLVMLFSDRWANEHTYKFIKLYFIYFVLKGICSKFDSYSSAIYCPFISSLSTGFDRANIFFRLALMFSLSQIDISGLIFANIIYNFIKIIIEWTCAVKNEFIEEENGSVIVYEMVLFAKEAFVRITSIMTTLTCITICFLLRLIPSFDKFNEVSSFVKLTCNIVIICNIIAVFLIEKDDFLDILRIKVQMN